MSRLEDIKNAAVSPENLRDILEAMGSGWTEYIAMHAVKNIPCWGYVTNPATGELVMGWEITPDVVEYEYDDLTEEEKKEAVERMFYHIR